MTESTLWPWWGSTGDMNDGISWRAFSVGNSKNPPMA
jgi:hypothetical protein